MGATFRNPAEERRFHEHGLVTFAALEPEQVERFRGLHEDRDPHGSATFAPDLDATDRSLVEDTTNLVREVLAPVVAERFLDHRIAFATLIAKSPGEDSGMEPHDDRTYVDERHHRAVTVWIPLVDTAPELDNGCLHIVPGSNRLARAPAGSNTPDWYRPYLDALARSSVPLTCRAGDAVAYDTRTVHLSQPNRTQSIRLALAAVVVPRSASLVHVEAIDRRTRRRYVVDDGFYLRHSPRELRRRIPSEAVLVEEYVADEDPVAATEVSRLLASSADPIVPTEPPPERRLPPIVAPARSRTRRSLGWMIGRRASPVVPSDAIPTAGAIAAVTAVARSELWVDPDAALAGPGPFPFVDARVESEVQGRWGILPLSDGGPARWFDRTMCELGRIPGLVDPELWSLGPRSIVGPRVGPAPGLLRVLVNLSTPVRPAGIRFARATLGLPMGVAVVVDEAHPHVMWNDAEDSQFLLAALVDDPRRGPLGRRAARLADRRSPTTVRRSEWLRAGGRAGGWFDPHGHSS